jgi:hypothetical protein
MLRTNLDDAGHFIVQLLRVSLQVSDERRGPGTLKNTASNGHGAVVVDRGNLVYVIGKPRVAIVRAVIAAPLQRAGGRAGGIPETASQ